MSYVLDASAGVELLLETATGAALQLRLPAGVGRVPEIYYAEVAGTIRRMGRAEIIARTHAAAALDDLLAAPLHRAACALP